MLKSEYTDNENILFYNLDSIDAVTTKVDTALSNLDELKKIAQAGFDIASKNHTWDNIANIIVNLTAK